MGQSLGIILGHPPPPLTCRINWCQAWEGPPPLSLGISQVFQVASLPWPSTPLIFTFKTTVRMSLSKGKSDYVTALNKHQGLPISHRAKPQILIMACRALQGLPPPKPLGSHRAPLFARTLCWSALPGTFSPRSPGQTYSSIKLHLSAKPSLTTMFYPSHPALNFSP